MRPYLRWTSSSARLTWNGRRISREEIRLALGAALIWLIPVLAIWTIYFSPKHVTSATTAITYLIAVGALLVASRRPDRSLLILIVVFPFQGLLLALLYRIGMPGSIVRHLGAWKEILALAVVFTGVRSFIASGKRLDRLDKLALGYVAVAALYAALQTKIIPGAPSLTSIRLLGFRQTAGFVLLLFGARHAPLGPGFAQRATRTIFFTATVVAVIGIYEAIDSPGWNNFVVRTIQFTRYEASVLGSPAPNPGDIRIYGTVGGSQLVRIGSTFLDELTLSWYLVLPFAIGIERIVRGSATAFTAVATTAIGAALLLTQTRSAIAAGAIVVILTLPYAAGRGRSWRVRAALVIVAVAMLAVPGALATGVAKRIQSATSASNGSTAGHIGGINAGIQTISHHPLGIGLGTGAGTGQRFSVANDVIPENYYLEVGDTLGIGPMVLFVALTVTLLAYLRHATRRSREPLATAAWTAGVGLAVAAFFLQTWDDFPVAWTYWAVAGAMIAASVRATAAVAANTSTDKVSVYGSSVGPASASR